MFIAQRPAFNIPRNPGFIPDIYSMCGIAGIIQHQPGNYGMGHLQKMTDALAHRGPDGEGHWQNPDGHAMLGHRRLSIIDLGETGRQPMHYRNRYTIIHNGEVYNYIELREALIKKGHTFFSRTDTEVIAAAYDEWKDECVDQLDGMFAFAIWDEKEQQLFAARDRFGEKPFFYSYNGREFIFGSEMKALWAAGIEKIPNLRMLFNYITIGYVDNPEQPPETFYDNILKLPAAACLRYNPRTNELTTEKYWDIDPKEQNQQINEAGALERFNHLLKTAVERRLRSDVPTGTSLSGGLDSSAITAISHGLKASHQSHKCFTAVFPGFEKDESVYSKQVAEQFSLQQFVTAVSAENLLDDWEKLCYHQEEPFGSASIYAQYKVFELAREQGVTVLLDGQGADELLAGYSKYYKWYWQELFRNRRLRRSKEVSAAQALGVHDKFTFKNIIAAYFPSFATVMLEHQYLLRAINHEDLTRDFVKQQSKEAYYTVPDHFTLNGVLYFNSCIHGLEELLRYADRNSMAHGREVRLPFLSHELAEFVFSLPPTFKIRNGWTKWLLRESMHNRLPESITRRTDKVGFEPPQKNWMEHPSMQEAIREAKKTLADHQVLKADVPDKKIIPKAAHDADNFDWRYLSAATLFR